MVEHTARKEGRVIAMPKSRLTPSRSKSKSHSSKLKSMPASQVVALQEKIAVTGSLKKTPKVVERLDDCSDGEEWEGTNMDGLDDEAQQGEGEGKSGVAGMDFGAIGALSGKKKRRRRRRKRGRRRNKKNKENSQNVAIAGEVLGPAVRRGSINPRHDHPYLETGEDQSLKSDGGRSTAAAGGSILDGPGFTHATPARKVGKQVSGSTASSNAATVDQSTKKRKATEPVVLPGTPTSGPRKRPRVNFKEIEYAETPSSRDIPFNYVIRRRSKRSLSSRAGVNPLQESRFQMQNLAEGAAEESNQLIEERPERIFEGESPTSGSPIEAVTYSTKALGFPGLSPDVAQPAPLSTISTSGTLKSKSSVESGSIAQSPWDSPVKDPQRPGAAMEEAIGKARGSPQNGPQDISLRQLEIMTPPYPEHNGSVLVPSTALVSSGADSPIPQVHQEHRKTRKPRARKTGTSLPTGRYAKTSPYFANPPPKPRTKDSRTSPHFSEEVKIKAGNSVITWPRDDDPCYGLIQEELQSNPFQLLVACMFLNVTSNGMFLSPSKQPAEVSLLFAVKAVEKLREFLLRYPTPEILAKANVQDVTEMLRTLGLQNRRANTLIAFGKEWLRNPPTKYVGARKQGYPRRETLGALAFPGVSPIAKDERFEAAHLPGVGPYALDAWRIFCLDDLRGNPDGEEWTRVTPLDKELRGLLRWRWWARKGVRWVEEGDSEAFKKFWIMKCDGSVCHNMCKVGFPTKRCPRGELDLADPENHRGHIPPEFVIGGGRKEAVEDQTDIPDPALMADYVPFGRANAEIKGGDKTPDGDGEPEHLAPTSTLAARRGPAGTGLRGSHALLSEQRKRGPQAKGIIQDNHRLRGSVESNTADGTPRNLTRPETAETVCYILDPPGESYSQLIAADGVQHPHAPAPKPLRWIPLQVPAYEPPHPTPVSSKRRPQIRTENSTRGTDSRGDFS